MPRKRIGRLPKRRRFFSQVQDNQISFRQQVLFNLPRNPRMSMDNSTDNGNELSQNPENEQQLSTSLFDNNINNSTIEACFSLCRGQRPDWC